MEYLVVISIILIYGSIITIKTKKRIEETIPISIVCISIIIYITGMFNNLKLGVIIVGIMAMIGIAIILYTLCRQKDSKNSKEILERIITPGAIVYILLCILFIALNKGRVFEDYDEFNHWARIIKNMFLFNSYGINEETIVVFNEYPPFTAIFQYIFLSIKNVFREDIILTAQCILYLSVIIPITKNIRWNKSLISLILIIPSIIFIPVIFYENFYLNILVDGILGIMFASLIFTEYEEKDPIFKYIKIFSLLTILTLTKTSGTALAVLALIIIIIKMVIDKNKSELKHLCVVTFGVILLTSIWYIKIDDGVKRWDFEQYIETENKTQEDQINIAETFMKVTVLKGNITIKELSIFIMFLIIICLNFYTLQKARKREDKDYKYYSISMIVSIPIYLVFLLITYMTIFDLDEAENLTCLDRYSSTIFLANIIFQLMSIIKFNVKVDIQKVIILFTTLIIFLPMQNIATQYINGKNYIAMSNINRDIYTKFRIYKNRVEKDSKILFIAGSKAKLAYLKSLNEYESNIFIKEIIVGDFENEKQLEEIAINYDYVFIYRIDTEAKNNVCNLFEGSYVNTDTLYKVNQDEGKLKLKIVRNLNER